MEIEFKVYQRFSKEDKYVHVGFERINKDGNWEYTRNRRLGWLLGVITDNQGNAEFKRMQYTTAICNNIRVYNGDIFEFDKDEWGGDDNIHYVSWDTDNAEWSFGGGLASDMEWRTIIGNVLENPELLGSYIYK